ncbi:MAG: RQC domain-containing protein, partial [Ghiorsea sp.]
NSMISLAESLTCRRRVLLGYFNEYMEDDCGNCDVCLDPPEKYDGTALSLVVAKAIRDLSGDFASGYIVDVLRGSKNKRILDKKHDELASHGTGKDINADEWTSIVRQLVHQGYYVQDISRRAALMPTDKSEALLAGNLQVTLAKYQPGLKRKLKRFTVAKDNNLFKKLVELRDDMAEQEDVAPHALLSDVTLTEMSQLGKIDGVVDPFVRVSGMGTHKVEAYGDAFASMIKSHVSKKSSKKSLADGKPVLLAKGPAATDAQMYTWNLYKAGNGVDDIAADQGVSTKTVLNHFIALVRAAHYVEVRNIIGETFDEVMTELSDADPYASLSEIKQDLSIDLTNEEFRLVLAWREGIGVS